MLNLCKKYHFSAFPFFAEKKLTGTAQEGMCFNKT